MDEYLKKNIELRVYACVKNMLMEGTVLINVGPIEYKGKNYQAVLEITPQSKSNEVEEHERRN